jgi:hypothetical protein
MALNNVPLSGQTLAITKTPINQNFSIIDTAFSQDHVPYQNANPGQGKHNQITFPVNVPIAPNTDPITLAGEMALYNKLVAGIPQLFIRQQNNGAIVNATSSQYNFFNITTMSGYTYLPSGVLIKWGVLNAPLANAQNPNIPFQVGTIPPFNAVPLVSVARMGAGASPGGITVYNASAVDVSVYNNGGATSFTYIAIGV